MQVFVFVNRVQEIGPRQTTALLIAALHRQGNEVWLADVDGISLVGSSAKHKIQLRADAVQLCIAEPFDSNAVASFSESINSGSFSELAITTNDLILIRTNPGRDLDNFGKHGLFLELCKIAVSVGIRVTNDPSNLAFFASKTAVSLMPQQYRPEMLVTHKIGEAVEFIKDINRECVIKPVLGSRGNNVIRVGEVTESLPGDLADRFGDQSIVVQRFVDSDEPGDKRVIVLNGKLVERNGHLAGIHRIPPPGEFRANLHAGGQAHPLVLSAQQREASLAAASILEQNGIHLAGIDLIGTQVIEFNVFSTGGIFDANRFAKFDFSDLLARAITSTSLQ